jgi:hypothetical protein
MDPKSIGASGLTILAAVAASVGVTQLTTKAPQEMPPKQGASSLDVAVYDALAQAGSVKTVNAVLKVSVVEGVYGLHWWCDGQPCPKSTVAEIEKAAEDGVSATLTPTLVGDEVKTHVEVQRGERPVVPELLPEDAALLGIKDAKEIEKP